MSFPQPIYPCYAASAFNPITTGLVSWYKFAEGTGTTTADSGTNGNTGTLAGTLPTWVSPGPTSNFPNAIQFNSGAGGVTFASPYGTSSAPGGSTLSVCGWLKPPSSTGGQQFAIYSGYWEFYLGIGGYPNNDDKYSFDPDAGSWTPISGAVCPFTNTWVHLAGVCTLGATNGTILYVNGTSVATGTISSLTNSAAQSGVGGFHAYGNGFGTNCIVGDVRFYNRVLTPTEVASIAAGTG